MDPKGGLLLKRKDFLGVDEEAGSHPNRTYYFKKNYGDLNKVIQGCTKLLQNEPGHKESLLLRGTMLMKLDRYKDAIEDFTRLLCLDPTSIETYYKRGVAYTKIDAQDAAISDFSKVLSINPDHVNAAFARAACYNAIGHFSRAIEDYNSALLKDQSMASTSSSRPGTPGAGSSGYLHLSPDVKHQRRMYPMNQSPPVNIDMNAKKLGGIPYSSPPPNHPRASPPVHNNFMSPSSRRTTEDESLQLHAESTGSVRLESEDDNSTVISGITFMSNTKGYMDSPGENSQSFTHLPLSSDEYHQKGYEFRRQGKFELAVEEYSKAIHKDPKHFKALFNRAFAMDKLGEHKEAIRDYTRALDVDPNNAFAFYNRGISHDRQHNYFEASVDFKRAIELSPNNLDFLHNLALCLRKMGQTQEALETYSKCLQVDSTHVKARHGRAMCYETLKLFDKALQDYDYILLHNSQHMLCMVSRAHLLHRMSYQAESDVLNCSGENNIIEKSNTNYSNEAYSSFTKSLEILCPDINTMVNSISNHSSNVSSAGSISSLNNGSLSRCTETISIFFARAKIMEERGDYMAAIQDFTAAIRLASAYVKSQGGNYLIPKSSSTSNFALDMQDSSCLTLYLLFYCRAICWKACEQYSNATTDLTRSISFINDERHSLRNVAKTSDGSRRLQALVNALNNAYNHRGFCSRKLNDYDAAIADYSQAILVVPNNSRALNNRAYCYAKKELYAEAVADYTSVIEIDPYNSHSYHNRGISLDKLGNSQQALADFEKVIELDSSTKPVTESEQIDISSSFRERYAHHEQSITTNATSTTPPPQVDESLARNGSTSLGMNHKTVSAVSSFPPERSIESCSKTGGSTVGKRKPRRPPPSRPTTVQSSGPEISTTSVAKINNTVTSDDSGNSGNMSFSSPLDSLVTSFGKQARFGAVSNRSCGEGKHHFDPIRLSPRGSSPMKRNKASSKRAESNVENSYNTRSFIGNGSS